jgi:hypothetical protein
VKDKGVGEVVQTLLLRISMPGIGPATVPALTELVVRFNDESEAAFNDGQSLLLCLAERMPACFNSPDVYKSLHHLMTSKDESCVTAAVKLLAKISAGSHLRQTKAVLTCVSLRGKGGKYGACHVSNRHAVQRQDAAPAAIQLGYGRHREAGQVRGTRPRRPGPRHIRAL